MYKLDAQSSNLNKLKDVAIILIGFTSNQLILSFESGDQIVVEGNVRILQDHRNWSDPISSFEATEILETLDSPVVDAEFDSDSNLRIVFASGFELILINDSQYESFRIKIGGKETLA